MTSKRGKPIRFAVGSPRGPTSAIWRLWVTRSDVYIAARRLAATIKVSLHESGQWQHSFTAEFEKRQLSGKRLPLPTRHMSTWPRPREIGPGVTLACRIIVPHSEVTAKVDAVGDSPSIAWMPRPPEGSVVEFQVWLTKPETVVTNWPGYRSRGAQLIGKTVLGNGQTVWVTALEEPVSPSLQLEIQQRKNLLRSKVGLGGAEVAESEFRAILFGHSPEDGSMFYIDLDMSPGDG